MAGHDRLVEPLADLHGASGRISMRRLRPLLVSIDGLDAGLELIRPLRWARGRRQRAARVPGPPPLLDSTVETVPCRVAPSSGSTCPSALSAGVSGANSSYADLKRLSCALWARSGPSTASTGRSGWGVVAAGRGHSGVRDGWQGCAHALQQTTEVPRMWSRRWSMAAAWRPGQAGGDRETSENLVLPRHFDNLSGGPALRGRVRTSRPCRQTVRRECRSDRDDPN